MPQSSAPVRRPLPELAPRPDVRLRRPRLLSVAAVALVVVAGQSARASLVPPGYGLLFEDDFSNPNTLPGGGSGGGNPGDDDDSHNPETAPPASLQAGDSSAKWINWKEGQVRRDAINDPNAVSIADGNLTIKTWSEREADGSLQHHSGMIATQGIFENAYGYYEARIDFNDSPGQWSAFWMYQDSIARDPSPTGATGVELDIMEHRVRDAGGNDIAGQGSSNTHWNGYEPGRHMGDYSHTGDLNLDEGFHTYGLDWSPDGYEFSIDGNVTWTAPNTPTTDVPEYLLLSSEVENYEWAGRIPTAGYGTFEDTQTKLVVDYVRVYGVTPVPEPMAAGVLGVAGVVSLVRRRRA